MKKILVILGHPTPNSFCSALSTSYIEGARSAGAEVQELVLADLSFDPNLSMGYKEKVKLESDLQKAQQLIKWADHLVFVYPSWWASAPALLKGFIDRVFLPGFAFQYEANSPLPKQLLKGKTARLIVTMDAPYFYYRWFQGQPGHNMMKKGILQFCGVKPVRITSIDQVRKLSEPERVKWLQKIKELGRQMG